MRLTGCDARRLEAQAGRHGGLRTVVHGDEIELTCTSGCLVFLPFDCPVEILEVAGDARVTDLQTQVRLGSVQGDLRLRRLTGAEVGSVAGDMMAQRVSAGLRVGSAGGDVRLNRIEGEVRLGLVGGDLDGAGLDGSLEARIGGDATVSLEPRPGTTSVVQAGGDVVLRVPPEASVVVELRAGGDLSVAGARTAAAPDSASLTMGDGEARLTATAGGDLAFSGADPTPRSDLASVITAQVEAALAEVEADLEVTLDSRTSGVGEQVRRVVERALRPIPGRAEDEVPATTDLGAERLMILRMLADGKLSASEAEDLFRALEGSS